MAKNERIRRQLCSQKEEKDLFEGFDNLLKVAQLIRVSPNWGLRMVCLLWVSILLLKLIICEFSQSSYCSFRVCLTLRLGSMIVVCQFIVFYSISKLSFCRPNSY